ncbi:unnamed protein product [Moneuplotes crassus]|uniref:Sulfurtransferase n=3 Tax=Euplotes crassus TaxID=5936 RepID=A0AAD1XJW6_EUPCR|nr:unnamed protein product [Moneuplotes crassus]
MEVYAQHPYYQVVAVKPKTISTRALASKLFIEERTLCFVTGYYLKPFVTQDIKLIDCTMGGENAHRGFLETSIPTAVFLDTSSDLTNKASDLPNAYPTKDQVLSAIKKLGLNLTDRIVLYGQPHMDMSMTRAYHILHAYGFTDVTVLDGGLLKFTQDGYPTCPGIDYTGPASQVEDLADPSPYLIQMDEIIEFAEGKKPNMQLIDARGEQSFNGNDPNLPPGTRQGHVPGAINIPADTFINSDDDTFLKYPEIVEILESKGIDKSKDIVVMCKTGVTATINYLALTMAGYTGVRLYDGSWTEYGAGDGPIAETTPKMPFYYQPVMMPTPQYYIVPSGQQYMAIQEDKGHLPVYHK